MSASIIKESADLFTIKISGVFTYQDLKSIEKAGTGIPASGTIKVLILANEFGGWGKEGDWGDLSFMYNSDQYIEKIAIVAKEKWRDELLMFFGAGRRQALVEFFLDDEEDQARKWLSESVK